MAEDNNSQKNSGSDSPPSNDRIGFGHLEESLKKLERDIENTRRISQIIKANLSRKGQMRLDYLDVKVSVDDSIRRFLLEERNFTDFEDFDSWARKVGPDIVCSCVFKYTGEKHPYAEIRETARQCLTNPTIEVSE